MLVPIFDQITDNITVTPLCLITYNGLGMQFFHITELFKLELSLRIADDSSVCQLNLAKL